MSMLSRAAVLLALVVDVGAPGLPPSSAAPDGSWSWPVVGPVIRPFDPPDSPYGSGHRGIDIAASPATVIVAPAAGTVKFAGRIGGHLFASVEHGGGIESTYSWVGDLGVRKGDVVFERQPIGHTGAGHPGSLVPHLHFGVKLDGGYVDPLSMLSPGSVVGLIRLAPLAAATPAA